MVRLYLDSDGIAANWTDYILANYLPNLTIEELNKHPERTFILEDIYKKDPHVFKHLEPVVGFDILYSQLRELQTYTPITIKILTAIGKEHQNPEVVTEDKRIWFKHHFGIPHHDVIVVNQSEDKHYLADRHSILVDDFDDNILSWVKVGGHGILVDQNQYCPNLLYNQIKRKAMGILRR